MDEFWGCYLKYKLLKFAFVHELHALGKNMSTYQMLLVQAVGGRSVW